MNTVKADSELEEGWGSGSGVGVKKGGSGEDCLLVRRWKSAARSFSCFSSCLLNRLSIISSSIAKSELVGAGADSVEGREASL
jgi:hypothetical protein